MMKRFAILIAVILLSTSVYAGPIPNGGRIYLNCENFQTGGVGSALGTAQKTVDSALGIPAAKGNCVLVFNAGATNYATVKFFYPFTAEAPTISQWAFNPTLTTSSANNAVNTCWVFRAVCSSDGTPMAQNDGSTGVDSAERIIPSQAIAYTETGIGSDQLFSPYDYETSAACTAANACRETQCVGRLTRANCGGGSDDAGTAYVYGFEILYPTP